MSVATESDKLSEMGHRRFLWSPGGATGDVLPAVHYHLFSITPSFTTIMPCTGECQGPRVQEVQHSDPGHEDDIWASDDDEVSAHADLKRAHVSQGYLDGITHAQELGLQKGFDDGYPAGASLGIRVGRILARLHGTPEFDRAKGELNITKVLDKQYFDESLETKQHALVEKWEK